MRYKKMIEDAKKKGMASEEKMWKSISQIDDLMAVMESEHPKEYVCFLRKQHEIMYGCHYDDMFARLDIEEMYHTDREGKKRVGEYWTKEDVESVSKGMVFPNGTTLEDKWVAFNAAWHDFSKEFTDSEILKIGYLFYFADEDSNDGKVWRYMSEMRK